MTGEGQQVQPQEDVAAQQGPQQDATVIPSGELSEVARALLDTAERLGYAPRVVRITHGIYGQVFEVPHDVAEAYEQARNTTAEETAPRRRRRVTAESEE